MMRQLTLGRTGITVPQNAFGALPIQRVSREVAVGLLRKAWDGGMRYFDTARAYTDSEEKLGAAFGRSSGWKGRREELFIATKTHARTPEDFRQHLAESLKQLDMDYIDVYQFHLVDRCWRPGDGSGMYECMQQAKAEGKIRHFGVTAHKIGVAEECVESGLYETMQFPFSYLSSERDLALTRLCRERDMGFIAMKSLAGGLINRSDAAMAYTMTFDNVLPIWGIQREKELAEWLACMTDTPEMTPEIRSFIERERRDLSGDFCRGCGYCMPCPQGIEINQCARISQMLRRAPSDAWLTKEWQDKMAQVEKCVGCGACTKKCPYELDPPALLKKNYEDYRKVLAGEVSVR